MTIYIGLIWTKLLKQTRELPLILGSGSCVIHMRADVLPETWIFIFETLPFFDEEVDEARILTSL